MRTSVLATLLAVGLGFSALAQDVPPPFFDMPPDVEAARAEFLRGNHGAALAQLRPLAEAGDMHAQNIVGAAYDNGMGVDADPIEAMRWFELSAAQGYGPALQNLGQMMRDGRPGIEPDLVRARSLLEQAAETGWPPAQAAYAYMLVDALGGPQDYATAIEYFERGRAEGDDWAHHGMARMYREGWGVERNLETAFALELEAADLGLTQAMSQVATMYDHAVGTEANREQAIYWYRRAVEGGDTGSGLDLAWLIVDEDNSPAVVAEAWTLCVNGMAATSLDVTLSWKPFCSWLRE